MKPVCAPAAPPGALQGGSMGLAVLFILAPMAVGIAIIMAWGAVKELYLVTGYIYRLLVAP